MFINVLADNNYNAILPKKTVLQQFLPISANDIKSRGWDCLDVLFITGDAYVDHPSFGVPLLARLLESKGFRVAIKPQPLFAGMTYVNPNNGDKRIVTEEEAVDDLRQFGTPRLFVGIGSGAVDSMINNYTANKKPRSDDPYSPGDKGGARPDYAVTVYSKLARKAFGKTPIVVGGIEASLRRLAHYDYWKNVVKPSILIDSEADFVVYGMGEITLSAIASILRTAGEKDEKFKEIRKLAGIGYVANREDCYAIEPRLMLPSYEEIKTDKKKFLKATLLLEKELNPYLAKTVMQPHNKKTVVINPPQRPLTESELDEIYTLPFTKAPHPQYFQTALKHFKDPKVAREKSFIKAHEMIQHSITSHRGCFGGCSFCGLGLHQGKFIQSRSEKSIVEELKKLIADSGFKGIISDIGGPSANMYRLRCPDETRKKCLRPSCLYPSICGNLKTDCSELITLLKGVRRIKGIKKVCVASGVRFDLAIENRPYLKELAAHHVGGHLKVAPEHANERVLHLMRKPSFEKFLKFKELFEQYSKEAGKEQYLVPYFISNFPGCTEKDMQDVTSWLKKSHLRLQQVQSFIPLPMTMAAAIFYTGLNPETKEALFIAKNSQQKKRQQRLLQPHRKSFEFKERRGKRGR